MRVGRVLAAIGAVGLGWLAAVGLGVPAQGAWAATTDVGTTTVSFNIAEAIEVTSWPAAAFTLSETAVPGVPVVSQTLSIVVRSNAAWGLQISSDESLGMLREYDRSLGGYVVGGQMLGPLEWATNVNGPWTPVSSTPTNMFTNLPPTGEQGATVGFVLRVTPSFDDQPLSAGRVYRIVLTYTAGVGF